MLELLSGLATSLAGGISGSKAGDVGAGETGPSNAQTQHVNTKSRGPTATVTVKTAPTVKGKGAAKELAPALEAQARAEELAQRGGVDPTVILAIMVFVLVLVAIVALVGG
jgi:hypothetical protein